MKGKWPSIVLSRRRHYLASGQEDRRNDNRLERQRIAFSDKQAYFLDLMFTGLEHAYYLQKDIAEESIAWEIGKGLILTAGIGCAAKYAFSDISVASIVPNFISDIFQSNTQNQIGNIITFTSTLIMSSYAMTCVSNKIDAISKAEKIVKFLTVKEGDDYTDEEASNQLNTTLLGSIIYDLYMEFSTAIEILKKNKRGSLVLIEFFIESIVKAIFDIPKSKKLESYEEKLAYLRKRIFLSEIPNTKLSTEPVDKYELEWQLDELLKHSPIVLITPIAYDLFQFKLYNNISDVKFRFAFSSLFSPVMAEGSHKYPLRIMFSYDHIKYLAGYVENKMPIEERCVINIMDSKFIPCLDSAYLVPLFYYTCAVRRSEKDEDVLSDALIHYQKNIEHFFMLAKENEQDAFGVCIYMQNLINIFLRVFEPITQGTTSKKFEEIRNVFHQLSQYYYDEDIVNLRLNAEKRGAICFGDREDDLPLVLQSRTQQKNKIKFLSQLVKEEMGEEMGNDFILTIK